jgi:hypothetical protein
MGRRNVLRAEELAALVLGELRKCGDCADVVHVTVGPCREAHPITGVHWAPTGVNPGTSGLEPCQRELWRVCERLGREYELAP